MSLFPKMCEPTMKDLLDHPVFEKMECAIAFQIDRIDIDHKAKKNMIRTFLKLYFSEFEESTRLYMNNHNASVNPISFITLFTQTLNDINKEALAKGIPDLFINRYDELCSAKTQAVYVSFENVLKSRFYSTTMDKITAMLDMLMSHLVFITLDAEKTLNDLNGRMEFVLKGSIFE